jgi:hypothetical protein
MIRKGDADLVQGMVINPKKQTTKKSENVTSLINRIIDLIRNKDKPCSLSELQKEIKDSDLRNRKFLAELSRSDKLRYDEHTEMLSLKSKYGISNIEELKAKIRQSEFGIPEDDELKDVYPGVKNDLELLKKQNFVKVIENEDKSHVLFFRDTSDKFEQKLINPEYAPAVDLLRKIWKDEIKYYDTSDKSKTFLMKRRPAEEMKMRGQKRRKVTKWANEHYFNDIITNSKAK